MNIKKIMNTENLFFKGDILSKKTDIKKQLNTVLKGIFPEDYIKNLKFFQSKESELYYALDFADNNNTEYDERYMLVYEKSTGHMYFDSLGFLYAA